MEIDQPVGRVADGRVHIRLFDVQVKGVDADAAIRPYGFGQHHGLVSPVEEVRLEAVEGFQGHQHSRCLGVGIDFPQPLHGPGPLLLRRVHGRHFAHLGGHNRHFVATQLLHHRNAIFDVLNTRLPHRRVRVDQVPPGKHQADGPPTAQTILFEQFTHFFGVKNLRFAADFDTAVAVLCQPPNGNLNRFGPHPIVHRQVHKRSSVG